MTTPVGLELVWADAGGTSDPGDAKYQLGWLAEIPTFQNFNHVLNALDRAKLSYAENDIYYWQDNIGYTAGARVNRGEKTYYCKTPHNSDGSNPQDPELDTTNSYWVNSSVFSSQVDAFTNLDAKSGLLIDRLLPRDQKNKWTGSDLTINNINSIIALTATGASDDNLLFGNVGGKMVIVNVGNTPLADDRDIAIGAANKSYEVYHEGHKPTQAEVEGTIPTEPQDGKLYARRSGNWVEVTSTTVSTSPPPPVKGNGQGWYNLDDGQYYIDIDDGSSSQWVIANPPLLPELHAANVEYADNHGLGATEVQGAIDELASRPIEIRPNLFINGDFQTWQRGDTFDETGAVANALFAADRWHFVAMPTNFDITRGESSLGYGDFLSVHNIDGTFWMTQKVEMPSRDVTIQGEDVTFSFTGVFGAAHPKYDYSLELRWVEEGQTADLGSASTPFSITSAELNPEFYKAVTMQVPSITAYDVNLRYCLQVILKVGLNNTWETAGHDFYQMKLELGSEATPFVADDPADNLSKCQRYYFQTNSAYYAQMVSDVYPKRRVLHVPLPTSMRATPAITPTFNGDASFYYPTVHPSRDLVRFNWFTDASLSYVYTTLVQASAEI